MSSETDEGPRPIPAGFLKIDPRDLFGPSPMSNPMMMAEAFAAKVDELHAIIDEADDLLGEIDCGQLAIDLGDLQHAGLELADRLVKALNVVLDARAVLGRAIPGGEEGDG